MAFNLNKNEGAGASSKFDLSKNNPPTATAAPQEKSRPKTWLYVAPVLLAAGIAAWYFLSGTGGQNNNNAAADSDTDTVSIAAANRQTATTATPGTPAVVQKETAAGTAATTNNNGNAAAPGNNTHAAPVTAGELNNKVPATFVKGSHAISSLDDQLVKDIIAFLKKDPRAVITVNGYASSEGPLAVNRQIAQARANAFKSYLVAKGIKSGRINAAGKGTGNPVSTNDTEEGREKNRRVEIIF